MKITKTLIRKVHNELGYTIVELLAVVAILVVVTGVIASLIAQTLRGGSSTYITNDVAQAGNYAISTITNTILTAENVVAVDGNPIVDCTATPSGQSIELYVSDNVDTILYECTDNTIASNGASLIDEDGLRVDTSDASACYFTCQQQANDPYTPPTIKFGFTITQNNPDATFENRASAPFETSALLRNYDPKRPVPNP